MDPQTNMHLPGQPSHTMSIHAQPSPRRIILCTINRPLDPAEKRSFPCGFLWPQGEDNPHHYRAIDSLVPQTKECIYRSSLELLQRRLQPTPVSRQPPRHVSRSDFCYSDYRDIWCLRIHQPSLRTSSPNDEDDPRHYLAVHPPPLWYFPGTDQSHPGRREDRLRRIRVSHRVAPGLLHWTEPHLTPTSDMRHVTNSVTEIIQTIQLTRSSLTRTIT